LSRTYDQIENILQIRERLVVALPKGHRATGKRHVGLRDLEGELLIMPSKDLLPSLHQMIAAAFLKNHMPLGKSHGGTFSDRGQPYKVPRRIYVPSIFCKDFVPDEVVLCYDLQVFLSDRWTRLLYGRVAM
jgi:hypothetical protein